MTHSSRIMVAAALVIIAMGGTFGAYYLDSSSTLANQERTISSLQSSVSSLASYTITSTVTSVSIPTEVAITTTTEFRSVTVTQFPNVPWANVIFMVPPELPNGSGCSSICFGGNFSEAILFDCKTAATQGCTVYVYGYTTEGSNYSITAQYPLVGQPNEPTWANCAYSAVVVPGNQSVTGGQVFAYCVPIGSDAFIIAEQEPGPA